MTEAPWNEHWFPAAFAQDIAPERFYPVAIHGREVVLFRDATGAPTCLVNRCPHRSARLSDGALCEGVAQCNYHGWRFAGTGTCIEIPQLASGQGIPEAANVRHLTTQVAQGVIWVHAGRGPGAVTDIPRLPFLDRPDCRSIDFAMDLPYGHDYLIENVLDYAHIHVAHAGVRGGGRRELAGPLTAKLVHSGPSGFTAELGPELANGDAAPPPAALVEYRAPGLVHYLPRVSGDGLYSGLALFAVPLAPGRCRLLYRAYGNHWPLRDRARPRFWEHGHQCHLLEQDMAVVIGQAHAMQAHGAPAAQQWLPLKTSDPLVLAYRRWIDDHDAQRSDALGLRKPTTAPQCTPDLGRDRWTLHTRWCSSCSRALTRFQRAARILPMVAFAALGAAIAGEGTLRIAMLATAVACQSAALVSSAICRRLTCSSQPTGGS